jgi:sec-independent protein translocase protein TatA
MGLDNPLHIAFLLLLLLLVFGAKRLPEMGRSLGEGLRGFKSSLNGEPMAPAIAAPVATPVLRDPPPAAQEQYLTRAMSDPTPATQDSPRGGS